ncbi:MAG TPA: esterase-like activity of phytase family protein [Baekduia sp.]|uniref:esterase-like activity of phytase family protein n=1 Tax=Baekduia sp. TaxID=2600305 RepID=UPI002B5ACC63|nr:esterase-like activity of phytase family protein [Baekduia sp.]HMJ37774.1 esterase-like activity of phytase family protein [Baekduia sp.]
MTTRHLPALLALAAAALAAAPAAHAAAPNSPAASLVGRAILPADATAPAPFPGVVNTDPAPAPGATQPVGGFSALIDAGKKSTYWAMPDNGFGSKANSRSFLLRLYKVNADFKTKAGGKGGGVKILDTITLRDPNHKIPFAIVNGATKDRLLTGGDFDIESVRQVKNGDFWFGEEFGPFLVHTDATGKVLDAPIPTPDVKSPDYPADYPAPVAGPANLNSSSGFEGMALSQDGSKLYPTLEGAVTGDDPQVRRMYEFDLKQKAYTSVRRSYRVGTPGDAATNGYSVSDLVSLDATHLLALERDNNQGVTAAWKRAFVVDLGQANADGTLAKRQTLDLLNVADKDGISAGTQRPGDVGLGDPFSFPYQTVEAILPVSGDRVAVVNDTNFGSTGRNPSLPDYSDFIQVRVPDLHAPVLSNQTYAIIGDTPYGAAQLANFPNDIKTINADPDVARVMHVGDIKDGSSRCDTSYFQQIRSAFDAFADPLVYTPGDNEWTDCHRANNGGYQPDERLSTVRSIFFNQPGHTMGADKAVAHQTAPYVENVLWKDASTVFGTVNVPGSNNDLVPWFDAAETDAQRQAQLQEYAGRLVADMRWVDQIFDVAEQNHAKAVVVGIQADMWDPAAIAADQVSGFKPFVAKLAERARRFHLPVLLINGDSHLYETDFPLADPDATNSKIYGIKSKVTNLQRLTVQGSTNQPHEWLKLRIDPNTPTVFSWQNMPFGG